MDEPIRGWCADFARYFRDYWLTRVPIRRWNHYENISDRTTNCAEGFHNKLNETIGRSHLPLRALYLIYKKNIICNCLLFRILSLAVNQNEKCPSTLNSMNESIIIKGNCNGGSRKMWIEKMYHLNKSTINFWNIWTKCSFYLPVKILILKKCYKCYSLLFCILCLYVCTMYVMTGKNNLSVHTFIAGATIIFRAYCLSLAWSVCLHYTSD